MEISNLKSYVFGDRVRLSRVAKRMTQLELADKTKIAQPQISLLERGFSPTVTEVALLSSALGVSFDELSNGVVMQNERRKRNQR